MLNCIASLTRFRPKMQFGTVQPVFKLELNQKVVPGVVTIGKYDGTHSCLTAAVGYDKVIIHNPYGSVLTGRAQRSTAHTEVSELNLNQAVSTLATGQLKPDVARDMLLIGSPSQVLAYDVHDNTDLFYKDAPDGVNAITAGRFGRRDDVITVIGGNSSVQALNWEGKEVFWNVVSGKVLTMILFDFDKDGENELVVGCEDAYIRVLKNNQFVVEVAETGAVTQLRAVSDLRYAYCLSNGTIGVYEENIRFWRVKSKQPAVSVQPSGEAIAVFWSNGRVDWRAAGSGQVLRRAQLRATAAGMLLADYRDMGVPDLVAVSVRGEVIGYPPYRENEASGFGPSPKKPASEEDMQEITELFNRKQALLMELQHYEANVAVSRASPDNLVRPAGAMPANTRMQVAMASQASESCVELTLSTNNDTVIRAALVLAEGMFESGETLVRHPPSSSLKPLLTVNLHPPRDVPIDIHIKAFVGYPDSEQFHVFELTKQLPRFAMYTLTQTTLRGEHSSHVTFKIKERIQRICIWINQNFLLDSDVEAPSEEAKELHVNLWDMRNETRLDLDFETDGTVKFSTPDMRLAGDLVQSLAVYLNLSDLESTALFPEVEATLRALMGNASELADTRSRLAADTAEKAQLVATLLPTAEDAASYDLREMLSKYNEVVSLNEELITGCHARRLNQKDAVDTLQSIHTILQQAARLRVGKHSKQAVNASRKAIQDNNLDALVKILRIGDV